MPDPDPNRIGVEWLPLAGIERRELVPDLGRDWRDVVGSTPLRRYRDDV